MRFNTKLFPGMVAAFLVIASPLGAFTLIESNTNQKVLVARGDTFRVHAQLGQAALGDGSVKLQPGEYNVEIYSMNPNGTGVARLTNNGEEDAFPTWSPDSRLTECRLPATTCPAASCASCFCKTPTV